VPTAESTQRDVKRKLTRLVRSMEEKYGPHIYPDDPDPIGRILFAMIAAKNPVTNARKAVRDFKEEYVDWNEVRVSTVRQIEETLEKARVEAPGRTAEVVKDLLEKVFNEVCRVSLDSLRTDGPEKARKTVQKLDTLEPHEQQYLLVGAGVEDAPPLDPATDRILSRLGAFQQDESPAKRRKLLETLVASSDALRFYHLMVEHGKKTCTEADPKCARCPAQGECEFFKAEEAREREAAKERARLASKKDRVAAGAAQPAAAGKKDRKGRKASSPGAAGGGARGVDAKKKPLDKTRKDVVRPGGAKAAGRLKVSTAAAGRPKKAEKRATRRSGGDEDE